MKIRDIDIENVHLQGETSLPFLDLNKNNFKTALEILIKVPDSYQSVLKKAWGNSYKTPIEYAKKAITKGPDFLAVKMNLSQEDLDLKIDKYLEILGQIESLSDKPLIITGSDNDDVDMVLLPKIAKKLQRESIIGCVNEKTYSTIIPVLKDKHFVISQTPIDINLAKELNILISDIGFDMNKVLIDTTIGALGYGLDYAYSVIERIKQAAFDGDEYLNMPIVAFVGDEVWKTKETKSSDYSSFWGSLEERAIIWETTTAGAFLAAGANILVVRHPRTLATLNKLIWKGY